MNLFWWLLAAAGACYGGMCGLLFVKQRDLLYYPVPRSEPGFGQTLQLENDGERLEIIYYPGQSDRALLYFGGNAENVAFSGPRLAEILPDYSLLLMNYRGYGGSTGRPSQTALVSDGTALYDLAVKLGKDRITLMGRSLGTGVALQVAARRSPDNLVLITPFDSMVRLAGHYYPWVPVSLLLLDRYDSAAVADSLAVPTLAVLAGQDQVIPRERSEALLERLSPKWLRVEVIDRAGHNDIEQYQEYGQSLSEFLGRAGR